MTMVLKSQMSLINFKEVKVQNSPSKCLIIVYMLDAAEVPIANFIFLPQLHLMSSDHGHQNCMNKWKCKAWWRLLSWNLEISFQQLPPVQPHNQSITTSTIYRLILKKTFDHRNYNLQAHLVIITTTYQVRDMAFGHDQMTTDKLTVIMTFGESEMNCSV